MKASRSRAVPRSGVRAGGAIALSFALDSLFAEPPRPVHPVALFGRLVALIDREWRFPTLVGALASVCLPLVAAGIAASAVAAADRFLSPVRNRRSPSSGDERVPSPSTALATSVAAGVLFSTTSRRMLIDTARGVVADSDRDPPRARHDLRALAGRDSADLSPGEVRSAAVESVSENLADGLVAPLLAFALVAPISLPAAAGATAWVKAVNTMDSMLGYRSVPTGGAPARLDDCVMWVPARLTALALALATANPSALRAASVWAHEPPSPNSGWPMATLAALCDVRLEKPGVYTLNPREALPTESEANDGIDLVSRASASVILAAMVFAAIVTILLGDTDRRGKPTPGGDRTDGQRGRRSEHAPALTSASFPQRWTGWFRWS